jgi:histidinol-phosphate aminotransferase
LVEQLQQLGFDVLPSAANFVFARHRDKSASAIAGELREQGLIVRHFNKPRIDQFLRITVGAPKDNQLLVDSLAAILGG